MAALTAVTWAVVASGCSADSSPDEPSPTGTVLVGVNGAAVEVPATWREVPTECSGAWPENAVYHPWPGDCVPSEAAGASFVRFTTSERGLDLKPAGTVDSYEIEESAVICQESEPVCTLTFGIPELGAYFTVGVPDEGADAQDGTFIHSTRGSLRVLTEDEAAIPSVGARPPTLEEARRILLEAGFEVRVVTKEYECPEDASCIGDGVTAIEPEPGSVVPAGSSVTITHSELVQ